VYVTPEWKSRAWILPLAVLALAPGWRGDLVPVPHEEILTEAKRCDPADVIPGSLPGREEGEQWHAQFFGSSAARVFDLLNLRGLAPHFVPPSYVAHIPPGMDDRPERADGYFRVETHWRWPWWWPGGGVDWRVPQR
jgi:hypothetical protein